MRRADLDTVEDVLVDIATVAVHIEVAQTFLQHGSPGQAFLELKQAQVLLHQIKLKTMAIRWMEHPETVAKLIKEQVTWLKRKYDSS